MRRGGPVVGWKEWRSSRQKDRLDSGRAAKARGPLEHVCSDWKPKVPFISADLMFLDLLVQAELPLLLEELKIQVTLH